MADDKTSISGRAQVAADNAYAVLADASAPPPQEQAARLIDAVRSAARNAPLTTIGIAILFGALLSRRHR